MSGPTEGREADGGLDVRKVSVHYGKVEGLLGVAVHAAPGEIVAVTGPSGAGKTTLLNAVAGIIPATAGAIWIGGKDVTSEPAWRRDAALVHESYVLYPHLNVFENIVFPLKAPRLRASYDAKAARATIEETTRVLEIDHLLERRVVALSGGQRQRVALARALVRDPAVFLLDEPLAHLDAKLRHWLRGELRRRLGSRGKPVLWATPDGQEALAVADRVLVLNRGQCAQFSRPSDLLTRPASVSVASLLGDPPMAILSARVQENAPLTLRLSDNHDSLLVVQPHSGEIAHLGASLSVGVRPSSLRIAARATETSVPYTVFGREYSHRRTIVSVRAGEQALRVSAEPFAAVELGETVHIDWAGAQVFLFSHEEGELVGIAGVKAVYSLSGKGEQCATV